MSSPTDQNRRHALPANTRLNGKYQIQDVLGSGGFGITYSGFSLENGARVAIKEYFPHRIALRRQNEDGSYSVLPFPDAAAEEFEDGRRRFLKEAGMLKALKHLDIIASVYDFFEENGTVYIVMEYIEGPTLRQFIDENGPMTFSELLVLFTPLILSLSEIHANGLIHRDISPDNLILDPGSRLHLIDFGATKQNTSATERNTLILKTGYAPLESYLPNGNTGTWTDVYSLCATMYFCLTGAPPLDAMQRMDDSDQIGLTGLEHLLPVQRAAIERGLQLRPANRLENMQKLYLALTASSSPDQAETVRGADLPPDKRRLARAMMRKGRIPSLFRRPGGRTGWKALAVLAALIILAALSWLALSANRGGQGGTQPPGGGTLSTPLPSPESVRPSGTPGSPGIQTDALLSMISVTGMKLKKAERLLHKLDPSIRIETNYVSGDGQIGGDSGAAGLVLHQSVVPNTIFTKGSLPSILLTVSRKATPTELPSNRPSPRASGDSSAGNASGSSSAGNASSSSSDRRSPKPDYQVKPDDQYESFPLG